MEKRNLMEESERRYIQDNILGQISKIIDKVSFFENMSRAKLMIESSISRLSYEKEKYEVKFEIYLDPNAQQWNMIFSARPFDCAESEKLNVRINHKS